MNRICVNQALILAAGKGTRLKEKRTRSKALVKVKGKPLICNIMDNMISSGINRFYIVIHSDCNFSEIEEYYKETKISINYIIDNERKGSLWSFQMSKRFIEPPFICADCDLIMENRAFSVMINEGINKISEGVYEGAVCRVLHPSRKDVDMLTVEGERAIAFNKKGEIGSVRGGYIYIWNFKGIFEEAELFIKRGIFSFSSYVDYIFRNHSVVTMDVIDLWDIDTDEDLVFTNSVARENK